MHPLQEHRRAIAKVLAKQRAGKQTLSLSPVPLVQRNRKLGCINSQGNSSVSALGLYTRKTSDLHRTLDEICLLVEKGVPFKMLKFQIPPAFRRRKKRMFDLKGGKRMPDHSGRSTGQHGSTPSNLLAADQRISSAFCGVIRTIPLMCAPPTPKIMTRPFAHTLAPSPTHFFARPGAAFVPKGPAQAAVSH